MPDLPHSLSGKIQRTAKRHLTVVPRSLPEAALHTVSEGPTRTQKVVENTGRSLRTKFPWRGHAIEAPRRKFEARTMVSRPTRGQPTVT